MRLGSGWDYLYHSGLTPGVLEWDWVQGGIMHLYHIRLTPEVLQ